MLKMIGRYSDGSINRGRVSQLSRRPRISQTFKSTLFCDVNVSDSIISDNHNLNTNLTNVSPTWKSSITFDDELIVPQESTSSSQVQEKNHYNTYFKTDLSKGLSRAPDDESALRNQFKGGVKVFPDYPYNSHKVSNKSLDEGSDNIRYTGRKHFVEQQRNIDNVGKLFNEENSSGLKIEPTELIRLSRRPSEPFNIPSDKNTISGKKMLTLEERIQYEELIHKRDNLRHVGKRMILGITR